MVASIISKVLKKATKKKPSAKTVKEKAKIRANAKPKMSTTQKKKAERVFKAPEARTKSKNKQPKDMRTAAQLKKERDQVTAYRKKLNKELDSGKGLSKSTLREAEGIIKLRRKTMAGGEETKLRAQKEKLRATKPKTAEARAAKKAKIKEINKKIFKITGRMEGMKNPLSEAGNMTPYAGRKTLKKTKGLK